MKKGICEVVVREISPDLGPSPPRTVESLSNIVIEIDTQVCIRCPYFVGPPDRYPPKPLSPGEEIKPPLPTHPDIYQPKPPEKKPLRF